MHYVKTKGARVGACKICAKPAPLTWDHVPPKGGITLESVEIEQIFQTLTGNEQSPKFRISQDGMKFRTICKSCNDLLGSKYDRVLNEFAIGIGQFLKTNLHLPQVIQYKTKPMSLARAILGHLLATKVDPDTGFIDRDIQSFFFDQSVPIPNNIHIFYWIYPYNQTVIVRDIAMPPTHGLLRSKGGFGSFDIFKYFPIAYLITDLAQYEGLEELTRFRNLSPTDEVEIPINLHSVRAPNWPENTENNNLILMRTGTNSAFRARPRRKQ